MDFKGKDVKIHFKSGDKQCPALIELSNTILIDKDGTKKELKKCTLINLDGKTIIQYEDTKVAMKDLLIKTTTHIACYQRFFIKEKESLKKTKTEDKKVDSCYHWTYQAYDYDGRALFCANDLWIEDAARINTLHKMAIEAAKEKEEKL